MDEVNRRLRQIVLAALEQTLATALQGKISYRRAAYQLAIGRVAEATRVRGLYP